MPNWLDPVGELAGSILFRFYGNDRPVTPRVLELLPASEVRRALPATTGEVSPEQRALMLKRRREFVMSRFGY